MKSWIWMRVLAGIMLFFAVAHSLGALKAPPAGDPKAVVFSAMSATTFPCSSSPRQS